MKLAICYSSKNQVELTKQTFARLIATTPKNSHIIWCDASTETKAVDYFETHKACAEYADTNVTGGADAAIAWKLTKALQSPQNYTHIMLLENDVLLDFHWFEPTMALFTACIAETGAVSPRSYVDRILIQRDGYAVMHNIGAGAIILTREAAEIVLRTFRTHWWPSNRYAFAQVSGIDIGTYAAFGGNPQNVTTDWGFEYQLLRHGLCALALTPARCEMIGQNPPLEQQGLELTTGSVEARRNDEAFKNFVTMTGLIREGKASADFVTPLPVQMGSTLFYPHQVGALFAQQQGWRLRWCQGWGPFSYVAGPGGASLSVRVSGSCSFLLSGDVDRGANVKLADSHTGFQTSPTLPPSTGEFIEIAIPGSFTPRTIALGLSEGGVFYGITCADPQLLDSTYSFTWNHLPEVA